MAHLTPIDEYYKEVESAKEYLSTRVTQTPQILIICGSGLGGIVETVKDPISVDYASIPHWPMTTVAGHSSKLVFGTIHGKSVACMVGRLHAYEGHSPQKLAFPIRVMKMLGVKLLIVTNASGGLNSAFKVGDIMIIKDHISLPMMTGQSPLMGPHDDRFGPRFTPMNEPYDRELMTIARKSAAEAGHDFVRIGVYAHVSGPSYETRSEAKFLSMFGDVVGMSTVQEVVVAKNAGLRILGLSLVTNMVSKDDHDEFVPTHKEVLEISKIRSQVFQSYVDDIISKFV